MKDSKESKDKPENKSLKLAKAIDDLKIGESISPTPLAKSVGLHPDTLRGILDTFDSLKEIGFITVREEGEIKVILKTDDSLDIKREINQIKNEINNLNILLQEIKLELKKR